MLFRILEVNDYNLGYLELLSQLTTVGDIIKCQQAVGTTEPELDANPKGLALHGISMEQWTTRYNQIHNNTYIQIWVMVCNDVIIATGTIIIEPKFIHNCGKVGHIEDIVVHKDKHGLGIGKKIIDELVNIARNSGCYKVILNTSEKNVGFYEKSGFKLMERQMALYF